MKKPSGEVWIALLALLVAMWSAVTVFRLENELRLVERFELRKELIRVHQEALQVRAEFESMFYLSFEAECHPSVELPVREKRSVEREVRDFIEERYELFAKSGIFDEEPFAEYMPMGLSFTEATSRRLDEAEMIELTRAIYARTGVISALRFAMDDVREMLSLCSSSRKFVDWYLDTTE